MLEIPCGRSELVLLTASSLDSMKAGLTRREWERRKSQTLMMLRKVGSQRVSRGVVMKNSSPVRGARGCE